MVLQQKIGESAHNHKFNVRRKGDQSHLQQQQPQQQHHSLTGNILHKGNIENSS
jgi:hypothetical protein